MKDWVMVMDKLEKQLKKNKQKVRDRRAGAKGMKGFMAEETTTLGEELTRQVSVKNIEYKPMDVEEAVMQMELITDNFFLVFTNARTDRVNVLYRRKGGNLGLIQPND